MNDDMKFCVVIMWICTIGMVATFLLQSPFVFLFAFGLAYSFFAIIKLFSKRMTEGNNGSDSFEDFEMRPLESGGKALREMTLGELMNKY